VTNLSPSAQAVLDAAFTLADNLDRDVAETEIIAAALRAAADQVEPDDGIPAEVQRVLDKLLTIADELEAQ